MRSTAYNEIPWHFHCAFLDVIMSLMYIMYSVLCPDNSIVPFWMSFCHWILKQKFGSHVLCNSKPDSFKHTEIGPTGNSGTVSLTEIR